MQTFHGLTATNNVSTARFGQIIGYLKVAMDGGKNKWVRNMAFSALMSALLETRCFIIFAWPCSRLACSRLVSLSSRFIVCMHSILCQSCFEHVDGFVSGGVDGTLEGILARRTGAFGGACWFVSFLRVQCFGVLCVLHGHRIAIG